MREQLLFRCNDRTFSFVETLCFLTLLTSLWKHVNACWNLKSIVWQSIRENIISFLPKKKKHFTTLYLYRCESSPSDEVFFTLITKLTTYDFMGLEIFYRQLISMSSRTMNSCFIIRFSLLPNLRCIPDPFFIIEIFAKVRRIGLLKLRIALIHNQTLSPRGR